MAKIHKCEKGFAVLEVILIFIIIVLIAVVGWFVYKDHQKTISNTNSNSTLSAPSGWKTYADKSAGYSVFLPTNWEYTTTLSNIDQPAFIPISVAESGNQGNIATDAVEVLTDSSSLSPKAYFEHNGMGRAGGVVTDNTNSINGYNTYTAELTQQGGTYYVTTLSHNSKIVEFDYYNFSPYLTTAEQITNSIKFN